MKTCKKCNQFKKYEEFYKPERSCTCKECHLKITREYKRQKRLSGEFRHTESLKQKERRFRLWQNTLLHDCKSRKLECDIDVEYINELYEKQNGKCYWFNVELVPSTINKFPQQPSLDRLDINKGYIKGNIVLSCYSANIGRNECDLETWKYFIEQIKNGVK